MATLLAGVQHASEAVAAEVAGVRRFVAAAQVCEWEKGSEEGGVEGEGMGREGALERERGGWGGEASFAIENV
jgi:hypothetical protein